MLASASSDICWLLPIIIMCLVCTVCSLLYIEGRCFSVFGIVLELENINRAAPLFRVHGAGVAEHGQTRTNHERGLMRGTQDPVSQEYVSSNLTPCTFISKIAGGLFWRCSRVFCMLKLPFPEDFFAFELCNIFEAYLD
jgi:hypothetical protein